MMPEIQDQNGEAMVGRTVQFTLDDPTTSIFHNIQYDPDAEKRIREIDFEDEEDEATEQKRIQQEVAAEMNGLFSDIEDDDDGALAYATSTPYDIVPTTAVLTKTESYNTPDYSANNHAMMSTLERRKLNFVQLEAEDTVTEQNTSSDEQLFLHTDEHYKILYEARDKENIRLRNEIDIAAANASTELNQLKHKLALAQEKNGRLTLTNEQNTQLLEANEREKASLKQDNNDVKAKLCNVEQKLKEMTEQILASELTVRTLQSQLIDIQKSDVIGKARQQHDATVRSLKDRHESEVYTLQQEIDRLTYRANQKDSEVEIIRQKLNDALERNETIIEQKNEALSILNDRLHDSQQKLRQFLVSKEEDISAKTKLKLDTARKEVEDLKKDNYDLSEKLLSLESIMRNLDALMVGSNQTELESTNNGGLMQGKDWSRVGKNLFAYLEQTRKQAEEMNKLELQFESQKMQLSRVKNDCKRFEIECERLKSEANERLKHATTEGVNLETDKLVKELSQKLLDKETEIQSTKQNVQRLTEIIRDKDSEIAVLCNVEIKNSSENEILKIELNKLKNEISCQQVDKNMRRDEVDQLNIDLETSNLKVSQLKLELQKQAYNIDQLKKMETSLKSENEKYQFELKRLKNGEVCSSNPSREDGKSTCLHHVLNSENFSQKLREKDLHIERINLQISQLKLKLQENELTLDQLRTAEMVASAENEQLRNDLEAARHGSAESEAMCSERNKLLTISHLQLLEEQLRKKNSEIDHMSKLVEQWTVEFNELRDNLRKSEISQREIRQKYTNLKRTSRAFQKQAQSRQDHYASELQRLENEYRATLIRFRDKTEAAYRNKEIEIEHELSQFKLRCSQVISKFAPDRHSPQSCKENDERSTKSNKAATLNSVGRIAAIFDQFAEDTTNKLKHAELKSSLAATTKYSQSERQPFNSNYIPN